MDYPIEILPNPSNKLIDCNLSAYYLIRIITQTSNVDEIWDKEMNNIKVTYICSPEDNIDNLSLSLLGIYTSKHIFLKFTEEGAQKYMEDWFPEQLVSTPTYISDFITVENRHYWCAPINKLSNKEFPYTVGSDPFVAFCQVVHTPLKWNFWHFSLKWGTSLGPLDELEVKLRKKLAKRIGHSARVLISHFAVIQEPLSAPIEKSCYSKN